MNRPPRLTTILLLALLQIVCKKASLVEPEVEDRGDPITPANEVLEFGRLLWSPATNELVYIDRGESLKTVNISTKAIRTLHASLCGDVQACGAVYYEAGMSSAPSSLYRIRDLSNPVSEKLADSVIHYAVSPDNTHIAVESYESTYIFDIGSRSKSPLVFGEPLTFSPDGQQLLFRDSMWASTFSTTSVATGGLQHLAAPPGNIFWYPLTFRWDTAGVRCIATTLLAPEILYVYKASTNSSVEIAQDHDMVAEGQYLTWSPDGSMVGYWNERWISWPDSIQYLLKVVRIGSGRSVQVAVADMNTNKGANGPLAFCDSNRKIAYVLGSQIYIKDIP